MGREQEEYSNASRLPPSRLLPCTLLSESNQKLEDQEAWGMNVVCGVSPLGPGTRQGRMWLLLWFLSRDWPLTDTYIIICLTSF